MAGSSALKIIPQEDFPGTKRVSFPTVEQETGRPWRTEQINGVVYNMATPLYQHSKIARILFSKIYNYLKGKPCEVSYSDIELDIETKKKSNDGFVVHAGDYVVPDLMIYCDKDALRGGRYYGVPKFVVEVVSRSTMMRDTRDKSRIYEKLGVSEYWVVNPYGVIDILYLVNGEYQHKATLAAEYDDYDEKCKDITLCTPDTKITLRDFPEISFLYGEIFQKE